MTRQNFLASFALYWFMAQEGGLSKFRLPRELR